MKAHKRQQPATGRVALACALAGSVTFTAQAQQRDNSSVATLEEIIVTATKRAERLQDVPVSVKALDAATLEQINADGLEDIARMVPSLSMTNLSRGGNQVQIRGLRTEDFTGADGKRDRRAVKDPAAPPVWARFYELGTNKPIYMGRDKVVRYDFNEIEQERRARERMAVIREFVESKTRKPGKLDRN